MKHATWLNILNTLPRRWIIATRIFIATTLLRFCTRLASFAIFLMGEKHDH